ncbi:MAG: UDP-2,3-diacylglucosamine diphosphatase [Gammaproteobacteria bacterium]
MATLFISDLHLDDTRPDATETFLAFLRDEAPGADALYILGDLFEYWLGDDAPTPVGRAVAPALRALSERGVPIFFTHGNRDFLLGPAYADAAGMQLLAEEHVVDLYGAPTLLLHGDTLCTDDVGYQQVRTMLRDPAWQADFLSKSPEERVAAARKARELSAEYKDGVSMEIMDVNAGAVADAMDRHGVRHMIHGHTHRPAIHEVDGRQRVVLGDWYEQGSVLTVSDAGISLDALPWAR